MRINKDEIINQTYIINMSAAEIENLFKVCFEAHHKGIEGAHYFYDKLEDNRPGGGFVQKLKIGIK